MRRGDGDAVAETIETFCRVSKDGFASRAGELLVLRRWQKRLLGELFARRPDGRLRHRVGLIGMPRKNGKDLACLTPILTTHGWKTMGTVEEGDYVYGPDGQPTRVIATSEVFTDHRCYEVEFTDGAVIVAGEDHLWWVWDKDGHDAAAHAAWRAATPWGTRPHGAWRALSTKQIAASNFARPRGNGCNEYRYLLPRKSTKFVAPASMRHRLMSIVDVREVASVPTRCIQVDNPSHLYLAGEFFTPTHNSGLSSGIALDGLLFGGRGMDVYSCAGDKLQAGIVFNETKRMVQADGELNDLCKPMRDVIEVPSLNNIYRALSAEAYTKEGLNPSRVIFDEVHVQPNDELWDVMDLAMGARRDPLMIGITTAGVMTDSSGRDSLCYRLWQHGRDIAAGTTEDPSFYMAWWGAEVDADYRDPAVWAQANPGYDDLIDPEDFAAKVLRTPEAEFRAKRLNQWMAAATTWLPAGAWDACRTDDELHDGDTVYLGFDGSKGRVDATALVAVRPGNPSFVDLLAIWDRPEHAPDDWEVPVEEVKTTIRGACRRFRVLEILYDPYLWQLAMVELASEGLPCVEVPQSPERMIGATQRFYEGVLTRGVSHNGNEILGQHLRNAVLKYTEKGARIVKESKWSGRRIDAAVATIMAFELAAGGRPTSGRLWIESMLAKPGDVAEATGAVKAGPEVPKPPPQLWTPNHDTPTSIFDALRDLPWR